jgi:hypothetical protein
MKQLLKSIKKRIYEYVNNLRNQRILKVDNSISWNDLFKAYNIHLINIDDVVFLSYYQSNIDEEIIAKQKEVFDKFNIPLVQTSEYRSHCEFLLQSFNKYSNKKFIIFFDIDCIPLSRLAIIAILSDIMDHRTLAGAAQTANQINNGKNLYIGPMFMGISVELFNSLKLKSLCADEYYDTSGILTSAMINLKLNVKYWYPTKINIPRWKLYPDRYFGIGTVYNGLVYHEFEIRKGNKNFINTCDKVLNDKDL